MQDIKIKDESIAASFMRAAVYDEAERAKMYVSSQSGILFTRRQAVE